MFGSKPATQGPIDEPEFEDGIEAEATPAEEQNKEGLNGVMLKATPWWAVSVMLHVLTIAFIGLITMTFSMPQVDDTVVSVIPIAPSRVVQEEPKKPEALDAVEKQFSTTDPNSKIVKEILIPPELDPEISDKFRNIDLTKPDTDDVSGNKDAHLFLAHAVAEEKGGGGENGPTLENLIGSTGGGSPGSNNGWGGGNGPGNGTDDGPGSGNWGRDGASRRVTVIKFLPPGVGSCSLERVERALRWLAQHQEPDGHWDTKKYESSEKTDTAMTGMALLAFLGFGHTEKVGKFKPTVQKAVAWLKAHQQANGLVFDTSDAGAHRGIGYPHAIAAMALCEAAGMANIADTRKAAQLAVDYSCNTQQEGDEKDPYARGAWRYAPKSKPDLSVTGWYVMQLKSAKMAHMNIPQGSFDGAMKFIDKVEHKEAGGDAAYGVPSTYWYMEDKQYGHGNSHHRLSAIGNLVRQYTGFKKDELQGSVEKFIRDGGLPTPGNVDLYYWYYGSLCAFQQQGDVWKNWRDSLYKTLFDTQRAGGDEDGSWDPTGEFHGEWGRVGQTALSALNMEVVYRSHLFAEKK